MKSHDILTNELLVRFDEGNDRLVVYTCKDGMPSSDVPISFKTSVLQGMGPTDASKWVGETLLLLVPRLREKIFNE